MSIDEMVAILDDPHQRLGWKGTPAGPELEEQVREWAFGIFARWETDRQVSHLLEVGMEEAADILTMAVGPDKESLLSRLPPEVRSGIEALLPVASA